MPKYLVQVGYTVEGARGLARDGGSKRRAVVEKSVKAVGGRVEAFYFSFGASDVVLIVDLPDAASMAALGLAVGASGAAKTATTPLLTTEEIDAACKKQVGYTPPGA